VKVSGFQPFVPRPIIAIHYNPTTPSKIGIK